MNYSSGIGSATRLSRSFGRDVDRGAVKPVAGFGDDGGEDAEAPPQAGKSCLWAFEQMGEGHLFNRLIFAIHYRRTAADGPGIPPCRRAPGNLERKQRRLFVRDQL